MVDFKQVIAGWTFSIFLCKSFLTQHTSIFHFEAATGGVVWKQVFLEISEFSQENTSVGVYFQ